VCINQLDDVERSHQVRIMGTIYKSTKECVMWLGEVEDEPIESFQPLNSWNEAEVQALKELIKDLKLSNPEPLRNAGKQMASVSIDIPGAFEVAELLSQNKHFHEMPFYHILPNGGIKFSDVWTKAVYSFEDVLRRTWWGRIWTAQEAFLPSRAVIHIGPHTAQYGIILEGCANWDNHISKHCCSSVLSLWMGYSNDKLKLGIDRILELKVLQEVRENLRSDSTVAHTIFLLSIQRSATLRHDHVYGLLGLITEFFHLNSVPDYSLDLARLYATTSIKFMENANHLCLLPYARPQHREKMLNIHTQEPGFLPDLPSWTPDWSTYAWGDYFDIYNYGGFTADKMQSYDGARQCDTILKLEGFVAGKVSKVGRLIKDMKVPPAKFVPIFQEWLEMAKSKNLSPRAIWEISHVATHKDIGLEKVDFQELWWEELKILAQNDATYQELIDAAKGKQNFQHCISSNSWLDKRAIFVIEPNVAVSDSYAEVDQTSEYMTKFPNGSIGMALPNVHEGDFVFIVKGGRTPFIFRPLFEPSVRSKALSEGIPEEDLSKCFTLVGVCYIYGMMQGQAMTESASWDQIYLL
jgi:Heterokaryon incompatibility protein (HET)